MSYFFTSFEKHINKTKPFAKDDLLLVAVSGGVDSIVLCHLLHRSNYQFAIAHCNFQLRGDESKQDENLVRQLASHLHKSFYCQLFDTRLDAKKQKISIQIVARERRYRWFEKLKSKHGFSKILTAHHANDQVETVLYNLTKGTGIAGIRGIPATTNHTTRPLLYATREEIEQYALANNLQWREDASNKENKYARNKIRHLVIPVLKEINPSIEKTFVNNTERFASLEQLLWHQCKAIKIKYLTLTPADATLTTEWYDSDKGGLVILTELLKAYGFSFDQCRNIGNLILKKKGTVSGQQFFSPAYTLFVGRDRLIITKPDFSSSLNLSIDEHQHEVVTPKAHFSFERQRGKIAWSTDKNTAYLDSDKLVFPLKIRNWKKGDAFSPLGMTAKKKLSDFMIDKKIEVNLKKQIPLIISNEAIVWVAGYQVDNRFKITKGTENILIIKMTKNV